VRTHAEHLAHTLNPVPLFQKVGHCVPVGTDDKIYKNRIHTGTGCIIIIIIIIIIIFIIIIIII